MKTVIITQAFEGYPVADDQGVHFAVADKPVEVPDAFADLVVRKGLAEFPTGDRAAAVPAVAAAPAAEPVQQVNHEAQ